MKLVSDQVQSVPVEPACHFLGLPAEIREQIYRLLLINTRKGNEGRIWFSKWPLEETCELSAQLLRTCSLVREEAAQILYGENEFCTYLEPFIFGKEVVAHMVNVPVFSSHSRYDHLRSFSLIY